MSEHHDHNHEHENQKAPAAETKASELTRDSRYWLSLEQWGNDPEFQKLAEQEFRSSPLREGNEKEEGWARREFLKLMGASLAMASAGCIRRPVQKIVPFNKQPEEVVPGVYNQYTSTFSDGSETIGILVRTKDGRPLKIEGNPSHPLVKGGTTARAQASILSLYDPERLNGPRKNLLNKERTNRDTISLKWEEADDAIVAELKKGGVATLTGNLSSPSTRALVSDFHEAFGGKHYSWEPLSHDDILEGQKASYGQALIPLYRFDKAKIIVSFGADFLGTWLNPSVFSAQFSEGRKDIKNMNKLVVFDTNYSLTGANADIRVRIKPSQLMTAVMALAGRVAKKTSNSRLAEVAGKYAESEKALHIEPALLDRLAEDLVAHKGQSLIVAGGLNTMTAESVDLQIAVNALNTVLGNDGATVDHKNAMTIDASTADLTELIDKMKAGSINTLIIHGVNPGYAAAAGFGFADALKKVKNVIYTGDRIDETGRLAHYVLPDNHPMENWGDTEISKGLFGIHQPTLRPLYDTRSFQLSLMTWAYMAERGPKRLTTPESYFDYLKAYWKSDVYPKAGKGSGFDDFWDDTLENGFAGATTEASTSRNLNAGALKNLEPKMVSGFELVLYPSVGLGDGKYANVAWLQELPDPVTKVCWDNYACISIASAEKLKVKEGHLLSLKVGDQTVEVPAHIQPGLHDDVIAIPVGYGRTAAGKVGNKIGVNVYDLGTVGKTGVQYAGQTVEVTNKKGSYKLANPQGHHVMEGRKLVVEATLKEYLKNPAANNHGAHVWSIWSGHQYNGHRWAMGIDLNQCTGCSACVISCQSENNIPVVGKRYVIEGREMAWIRIDRYYVGTPEDAQVVFQPILCQHCENAPCETVCPVAATVHSDEGLNDMVYNRCVGTRYCSNNCPYKVRRFNWFNFTKNIEKPMHLALNPDVTLRPRGVMEKCSFCVQRIKQGTLKAKLEKRSVKDGDIKPACQTACPSGGIVFGDLNDPESEVAKRFKDPRSYALLEEFHAKPMIRYMTKIRNNYDETLRGAAPAAEHGAETAHGNSEGGH